MNRFPCILFGAAFLWLYVPEIASYKITIADRARTMEVNLRWVKEKYSKKYLLVKLISRRAKEVPEGINFYMVAIFQPKGCINLRLKCNTNLRRPKNRVRLVRVNLECTRMSYMDCKRKGGCIPKRCREMSKSLESKFLI